MLQSQENTIPKAQGTVYSLKVVKRGIAAQKMNMISIQGQPTTVLQLLQ